MIIQLLFSSISKEFIGFGATSQDQISKSNFLIKEIEFKEKSFNLERYKVIGNYDDFKLVDLSLEKPIVYENTLIIENLNIIKKRYNLDFQFLINLYNLEKEKNFLNSLIKIIDKIEKEKIFFEESEQHTYISNIERINELNKIK